MSQPLKSWGDVTGVSRALARKRRECGGLKPPLAARLLGEGHSEILSSFLGSDFIVSEVLGSCSSRRRETANPST